mgnify:CR=1
MAHKGAYRGKVSRAGGKRVSAKISHLMREDHGKMSHQQMVASALEMERAGRLGPKGGYRRGGRRGKT